MSNSIKGYILLGVAILFGAGAYVLYSSNSDFQQYWYICTAFALISLIFGIKFVLDNRNPSKSYESGVKNILNTYDSILVQSNTVPKIEGRNIIYVNSMDDLIDAQLEIRKPICFYKQTESCSFVLLDDKEAYVYIEKLNEDVVSPLEIEIKENKLKIKNADEMDSEMLRDIEKTTIVKLSNKKSYKVSPIRKDKNNKSSENLNESLEKDKSVLNSFSKSDEVEIL